MYKLCFFIIAIFTSIVAVCHYWEQKDYPIDLVYLWVDGDDSNWLEKKNILAKKIWKTTRKRYTCCPIQTI